MTPSSVEHLLHAVIFSIFIGYQMAIQMAINVVVFSIFNIVTRDVPHCDQPRCFVPNICTARALMRWVIRLFCQSPDMGDCDYKDLHDQVSGWHLNKMATAVFSSIPSGAHDPMFNGRSDLLQSCSIMAHSPVGLPQGSCLYTSARELMRWLTALHVLCFVEAQYDTLEKGNCTRYNCKFRYIPAATTPDAPAQEPAAATNHLVYTLRRGYRLHSPVGLPRGLCLYTSAESSPTCSQFKRKQYSHRH